MKREKDIKPTRPAAPANPAVATWRIRGEDQQVFGPVDLDTLRVWAREGRIGPSHMISRDSRQWMSAPRHEALEMNWLVETSTGNFYGPIHRDALDDLIREGAVPSEKPIFYRRSSLDADPVRVEAAWTQRLQNLRQDFEARLAQFDLDQQSLRRERDEIRATLEARDLEFDAERQESRATAARGEAEKRKLTAIIESLRRENRDLAQGQEKRHSVEVCVQDLQRTLTTERESFQTERTKLTQELNERRRTLADLAKDHDAIKARVDDFTRLREQEQQGLRESLEQYRLRFRSIQKMLQSALTILASEPSEDIEPVVTATATVATPVSAHDTDAKTPPRAATLASIETQAQDELRRLQRAGSMPSFWRRGKTESTENATFPH